MRAKTDIEDVLRRQYEIEEKERAMMQYRKTLRYNKADYKERFDQEDYLYFALLSQTGGDVRVRAQFSDGKGNFGVQDIIILSDEVDEETRKANDENVILETLAKWFVANMHTLSEWKFKVAGGAPNMLSFNKRNTNNFYPEE